MVSSIFICSRMEELAEARQEVFDAIVDHGAIPEVFDAGPPSREANAVQALRSRRTIDELLAGSDKLVGIFQYSLGTPEPTLAGLSAVEYQFVRFLIQRRLEQSDDFSAGGTQAVAEELDLIMPDTEAAAGPATHALRNEMRVIGEELALLASLPRDHRDLYEKALPVLETIDRDSFYEGRPYFEIFEEDVLIGRRDVEDARPAGPGLARFLTGKPVSTFDDQGLYDILREWLVKSVAAVDIRYETDRTYAISTRFLSLGEILDHFHRCHLTVDALTVDNGAAIVTSQKPMLRDRELGAGGFYQRLEAGLDGHLLVIDDLEELEAGEEADCLIELRIANIPGMLHRIWDVLDRLDIEIRSVAPMEDTASRRHAQRRLRIAYREFSDDSEATRRRLAQQVRSIVGVQSCSVLPGDLPERQERGQSSVHLGECLVDLGVLSMRDVWDVLERRMEDELFGDAAQRLKPIGPDQVEAGLRLQRRLAS